jgi:hypothetical protein
MGFENFDGRFVEREAAPGVRLSPYCPASSAADLEPWRDREKAVRHWRAEARVR